MHDKSCGLSLEEYVAFEHLVTIFELVERANIRQRQRIIYYYNAINKATSDYIYLHRYVESFEKLKPEDSKRHFAESHLTVLGNPLTSTNRRLLNELFPKFSTIDYKSFINQKDTIKSILNQPISYDKIDDYQSLSFMLNAALTRYEIFLIDFLADLHEEENLQNNDHKAYNFSETGYIKTYELAVPQSLKLKKKAIILLSEIYDGLSLGFINSDKTTKETFIQILTSKNLAEETGSIHFECIYKLMHPILKNLVTLCHNLKLNTLCALKIFYDKDGKPVRVGNLSRDGTSKVLYEIR